VKRWLVGLTWLLMAVMAECANAQYVTLQGTLQASNGLTAQNYTISFVPTQWGFVSGTGVVVNLTTYCATSVDGSVVGITNPLAVTINTPAYSGGTLAAGNYYIQFAWITATSTTTLVSPESVAQLTAQGNLQVALPAGGLPAGVTGYKVYIGSTSGSETLQGSVTGSGVYTQSIPLVTGAAVPSTNNTICQQVANDAIWPVGTGYTVSLTDPSGNTNPGYPMVWQLLGPNTTINLSNGLPYYHGVVTFPVPILASPLNHAQQSISGPLSLSSYKLTNVGQLGVGTGFPGWGIDVEGATTLGAINAKTGFLINGAAGTAGQAPCSSTGAYIDSFCSFQTTGSTLYYQTVAQGGTSLPQEPKVNFINGANATVSCVDNAGASRTDCTVAATANLGPNPNQPHYANVICSGCTIGTGYNDFGGTVSGVTSSGGTTLFQIAYSGTYTSGPFCAQPATNGQTYAIYITPLQFTTTSYSITSNVVTFNVTGSTVYPTNLVGSTIALSGFSTATFFNGWTITVTSATSSTIVGSFTHANGGNTENGTITTGANYGFEVNSVTTISSPLTVTYLCHN